MLSRFEVRKDMVQELTESAATHVGRIATILTGAVREVTHEVGEWFSDAFEMQEAARRAEAERTAAEQDTAAQKSAGDTEADTAAHTEADTAVRAQADTAVHAQADTAESLATADGQNRGTTHPAAPVSETPVPTAPAAAGVTARSTDDDAGPAVTA